MEKMKCYNLVTSLVTSEDFVIGAQVMIESFLSNNNVKNANVPILTSVMITSNISRESQLRLIESGFDYILIVPEIPNPAPQSSIHVSSWFDVGFTKLRIWTLTQLSLNLLKTNNFETININSVFYIDADCIVKSNVIHLFDMFEFQLNIDKNCDFFGACCDVFPPNNFNAGVLFIKPSIDVFTSILREMEYVDTYDGGDTGFLNNFSLFKHWYSDSIHFGLKKDEKMKIDKGNDSIAPATGGAPNVTKLKISEKCKDDENVKNVKNAMNLTESKSKDEEKERMILARMGYEYNAQRILHWFTKKKPSYWDSIIANVKIIHYSSSPKPWNLTNLERTVDKVERIWHKYYLNLQTKLDNSKNGNCANFDKRIVKIPSLNEITHLSKMARKERSKIDLWKVWSDSSMTFSKLMTKRHLDIGKIVKLDKDSEFECGEAFENGFYDECKKKFYYFQRYLHSQLKRYQNMDNDNDYKQLARKKSDFILGKIPKIIHQIWLGDKPIPKDYIKWQDTWQEKHKGWKYMLWTDDSINENSGFRFAFKELFDIFSNECNNFGEKSDILRLELLYQFGGVYVDCDFECLQCLDVLDFGLSTNDKDNNNNNNGNTQCGGYSFMIGMTNTGLLELNNAMMASSKENEIVKKMIEKLIDNVKQDKEKKMNTIVKTGPIFITRCIMHLMMKQNVKNDLGDFTNELLIFPSKVFYPFGNNMRGLPIEDRFIYYCNEPASLAVHHWGVSWMDKKEKEKDKKDVSDENGGENDMEHGKGAKKQDDIVETLMNSGNAGLQASILQFLS